MNVLHELHYLYFYYFHDCHFIHWRCSSSALIFDSSFLATLPAAIVLRSTRMDGGSSRKSWKIYWKFHYGIAKSLLTYFLTNSRTRAYIFVTHSFFACRWLDIHRLTQKILFKWEMSRKWITHDSILLYSIINFIFYFLRVSLASLVSISCYTYYFLFLSVGEFRNIWECN